MALAKHEVYILEAGPRIAEGVTSRNSGVIHSPLNYTANSLKGALCAQGRELLYAWCAEKGVPHRQTGKLVVATRPEEEAQLERILHASHQNGAPEVRILSAKELHDLEPHTGGTAALFSPRTGIIDPYELSRSFLRDAEENGATLTLNAKVLGVSKGGSGTYELDTSLGPIEADAVINSAGLHADEIAALAGAGKYKVYPWRGDYFNFRPGAGRTFSRLIYPVKMKSDPGLGVHLTLDLTGKYRLGPDVELVTSKEVFSPSRGKTPRLFTGRAKALPLGRSRNAFLRYLRDPAQTARSFGSGRKRFRARRGSPRLDQFDGDRIARPHGVDGDCASRAFPNRMKKTNKSTM